MIRIRWNKQWIKFESVTWSGTEHQCSRTLAFTIPVNPYDKEFDNCKIKLGDVVMLYEGEKQLFVGTVTNRSKGAEIGTASYTAMDFMHYLLRSTGTYKFQKTNPVNVTKKLCSDLKIQIGSLAPAKTNIRKMYFSDKCFYDMIITAYRKAMAATGKRYMPVMSGKKLSVIEKGTRSGVTLTQGIDIIGASYSDTTENMVDMVKIYNEKLKNLGKVQNKSNVSKYGIYQKTYTKEKGVNAKTKAKSMLVGITKEASVEAVGNTKAISGYSIEIKEKAAGITGKFYISSDTHTFQNGVHTMQLGLVWHNTMSSGAETENEGKKRVTQNAECWYLESANVFHSSKLCSACKGKKNLKSSTVAKVKTIKLKSGKNKGKSKYSPCQKCWET